MIPPFEIFNKYSNYLSFYIVVIAWLLGSQIKPPKYSETPHEQQEKISDVIFVQVVHQVRVQVRPEHRESRSETSI
jgi:hypothetical protein